MTTINIAPTWHEMCRVIEMLLRNGTHEGIVAARKEMRKMATLANAFGKPLEITLFAMDGETLAEDTDSVEYYDVMLRCEGEDPIQEWENLPSYEEALAIATQLQKQYPGASFEEVGA